MTTVVATRTGIWTDSQCNAPVDFYTRKSEYIKDSTGAEFLVGVCGDLNSSIKAIELFKRCPVFEAFQHVPDDYFGKDSLDFELILVTRDKRLFSIDGGLVPTPVLNDYFTAGSGSHWAMAALDFGKTPEEAIAYAITKDRQSGGPVRVLRFPRKRPE